MLGRHWLIHPFAETAKDERRRPDLKPEMEVLQTGP
jgi:hypothetical protein